MLSFPPGLDGFNTKTKGCGDKELDDLRKAMWPNGLPSVPPPQDEIWGLSESGDCGDESTQAPKDSQGSQGSQGSEEGEPKDRSRDTDSSRNEPQEPEKELDPDSSAAGSFEHDTEHWLWMLEQMSGGYCPDLAAGAGFWGMPTYDPTAWSQSPFADSEVDIMQLAAASLHAANGTTARNGGVNGNGNIMQLAVAALEAANGKMIDPLEWNNVCTVMMRNLPNQVTQDLLGTEVNNAGFLHAYDFIYLPIDPETNANRGYAFINFTTPGLALMFKMHFEGRKLTQFNSNKVVSVVPAALQGFDANFAHCTKKAEEVAKPASRREGKRSQRGGRHKAESLIDIAARGMKAECMNPTKVSPSLKVANCSVECIQEATIKEPAKIEAALDATPPPPGLTKEASPRATPAKDSAPASPKTPTSPKSPKQPESEAPPKKFVAKFCPYCGGGLKAGFKFCRFCGSSVSFG